MKQIPLSQDLFAIVDDDDYERVSQFKWYAIRAAGGLRYAVNGGTARGDGRAKTRRRITLHEFVTGSKWQDHKNGNGLDCRKENMRPCTQSTNAMNKVRKYNSRSPYKGVHQRKKDGRWVAACGPNGPGRRRSVGYETPLEAAFVYDRMAREMYGEFARPNFGEGELL